MTQRNARSQNDDPGDGASVTIKIFGGLREKLGASHAERSIAEAGTTLARLLADLEADHPDLVEQLRAGLAEGYLNALCNGRNVRFLDGTDTALVDGDVVAFLPPVGGG